MKRLGEKIRRLRQQQGLTLREVAVLLGIHYTHLQKIEAGQKRPSSGLILKLADIFAVTADQLMRDEQEVG